MFPKSGASKNRRASKAVESMTEAEVRDQLEVKRGMLNNKSMFASTSKSPDPLETRLLESVKQLEARLANLSSVDAVMGKLGSIAVSPNGTGHQAQQQEADEEMGMRSLSTSPTISKMGKMPALTSLDLQDVAAAKDQEVGAHKLQKPKGPFDQLSQMAQAAKMHAFFAHQPDDSDDEDWDQHDESDDDNPEENGYSPEEGFVVDENGEQATDTPEGMEMDTIMEDPNEEAAMRGMSSGAGQGKGVVIDMPWEQVVAIDVARTAGKGGLR